MKKLFITIAFLAVAATQFLGAQTFPADGIGYQAMLTELSKTSFGTHLESVPVSNQEIQVRFELSQNNSVIFTDEQTLSTDLNGIFATVIGTGNITPAGTKLSDLAWHEDSVIVEVFVDKGQGFESFSKQKLWSTAYAQYADVSRISLLDNDTSRTNELQSITLVGDSIKLTLVSGGISIKPILDAIAQNASDIAQNATDIAANKTDIATNAADIATNKTDIATNAADIATNKTDIATNATDIATNKTDIANNATDIATNKTDIANNATDIATNKTDIATNATDIATNKTDIATNATDIATNKTDIATNATDIATNKTDIATNATDIATNKTDIANNKTNITTNTSDIANLKDSVTALRTDVNANTADIATNKTNINTNTTNIASLGDSITAHRTQINSNTSAINTNKTDIASNKTNITTNTNNISTLGDSISAHRTQINSNTSAINTNKTDIATNKTNITTNTNNISSNSNNITTNANNISSLNDSIASHRSALNSAKDNMGDHTATQNITLNGKYISNDGGNEGFAVDNNGYTYASHSVTIPAVGTSSYTYNSNYGNSTILRSYPQGGIPGNVTQLISQGQSSGNWSSTMEFYTQFGGGNSPVVNMKIDPQGNIFMPNGTLKVGSVTYPKTHNSTNGQVLTINNSGIASWQTLNAADNLGNHTASQNLQLNGKFISNDGGNEGFSVDNNGYTYATHSITIPASGTSSYTYNSAYGNSTILRSYPQGGTPGSVTQLIAQGQSSGNWSSTMEFYTQFGGGNSPVVNMKIDPQGNIFMPNGTLKVGSVTYPKVHNSTNGQVLTINSSGVATWTSPSSSSTAINDLTDGYNTSNSLYLGPKPSSPGNYNIGINLTGFSSMSGGYNTAIGRSAGKAITTGTGNTFFGNYTGTITTTGGNNTFVGGSAGGSGWITSSNSDNIGIGASRMPNGNNNHIFGTDQAYAYIYQGYSTTGNNQVLLGNSMTSSFKCRVSQSTFSDSRIKEQVAEDVHGIDFIMKLRPVTYNYKLHTESKYGPDAENNPLPTYEGWDEVTKIRFSGFIAQEVEAAANEAGYDFSGVDKPKDETSLYALRYAEFVVPLVKATQEQQQVIDSQKQQIENQNQVIQDLIKRIEALESK